MNGKTVINVITQQKWLDKVGDEVQPAIVKTFEAGGKTGQEIKDFCMASGLVIRFILR